MKFKFHGSPAPARLAAVSLMAAFTVIPSIKAATVDDQAVVNSSPGYSAERNRLLSAEPVELTFNNASLRDVLRMLATKAEIHFLSMPSGKQEDKLITMSMKMSPFAALEAVANENGIALVFDRGVWHMRPFNDTDLVARSYVLSYNTAEKVEFASAGSGGTGSSAGGLGSGGGLGAGSGSGGGGGSGGGLDLGNVTPAFKVDSEEIVKKVKEVLGVGTTGFNMNNAGEVTVDEFSNSPISVPSHAPRNESPTTPGGDKANEPKVVFNADSNALFVVASRQQHELVQTFLDSLDKPQSLIAVELKFVETSRDPKSQLGIDWSDTFDGGLAVRYGIPNPSDTSVNSTNIANGAPFNSENLLNPSAAVNFANGTFRAPAYGVLSPGDFRVKINMLLKDLDTSTVSYPRVLTQNNREVQMRSVVNYPVLDTSSSVNSGTGTGASTQQITFLPIGTTVNILPRRINANKVAMQAKIVVANIIGNQTINGNSYPIPSSRVYAAPLEVESGYTVAIAGLDEATDSRASTGIPVLSRIPVVGWAFKSRTRERNRKNLMIFITPIIMPADGDGVAEKPVSELPRYHSDPPVNAPQIFANGELKGGPAAIGAAITWSDREERRLRKVCEESRAAAPESNHQVKGSSEIAYLGKVNYYLGTYIANLKTQGAPDPAALQLQEWNLSQVSKRARSLYKEYYRQTVHTSGTAENTSLYFE